MITKVSAKILKDEIIKPVEFCVISATNSEISLNSRFTGEVLKDEKFLEKLFELNQLGLKIERDAKNKSKK